MKLSISPRFQASCCARKTLRISEMTGALPDFSSAASRIAAMRMGSKASQGDFTSCPYYRVENLKTRLFRALEFTPAAAGTPPYPPGASRIGPGDRSRTAQGRVDYRAKRC